MRPYAWAGRSLGSRVLLQQQVTLLSSHRGLGVTGGHPALLGTWASCCGIEAMAGFGSKLRVWGGMGG